MVSRHAPIPWKVSGNQQQHGDCKSYISASGHASSVIAKAKAEGWQTICSSLLSKSSPNLSTHSFVLSLALLSHLLSFLTSRSVPVVVAVITFLFLGIEVRCNRHSLLLTSYLWDWQNRQSFLQRLSTPTPGHLSSHCALSSYGLFALLALWRLSVTLRSLVHTLGNCPASRSPWSSAMPPSLERGRVATTTTLSLNYFSASTV